MREPPSPVSVVITGLIVSVVEGIAGYFYRDSFDAPRLSIQYARIDAPRQPIALSDANFQALIIDGNVMGYMRTYPEGV